MNGPSRIKTKQSNPKFKKMRSSFKLKITVSRLRVDKALNSGRKVPR